MSRKRTKKHLKIRARHTGRLEKRGSTFYARWMEGGVRHTESTGVRVADFEGDEAKAREAAEAWLVRRLAPLRARDSIVKSEKDESAVRVALEGLYMGELKRIDERRKEDSDGVPPVAVAEAADRLVSSPEYDRPKESTLKMTLGRINRFARWIEERHPSVKYLREVTATIAKEYAAELKRELGAGSYNTHLVTLNQLWKVLGDEIKGDGVNPWKKLPKQTEPKSERRPLTDSELRAIFAGAAGDRDLTILFALMLYTGCRLSDACLMRWESIHFDRSIVAFVALKTGARCNPPLLPELRALLMQTPAESRTGFIIPAFAESYSSDPKPMSNVVTAHFAKCGIETSVRRADGRKHPAATAHSFRHTYITRCKDAGVPLAVVQGWVGHMSKEMTENYSHDSDAATLLYARAIPPSPVAAIAAADAAQAVAIDAESRTLTDGTDAAQGRRDALLAILDGMSADELRDARSEIDGRLGTRG